MGLWSRFVAWFSAAPVAETSPLRRAGDAWGQFPPEHAEITDDLLPWDGRCPECGHASFAHGSTYGFYQNLACETCGVELNVEWSPDGPRAQRIGD